MKKTLLERYSKFRQKCRETQPSGSALGGVVISLFSLLLILIPLLVFSLYSVEATVRVVVIERSAGDNSESYRALFEVVDDDRNLRYASHVWSSFMPHEEGEVVAGRVNWKSGEIRSYAIMKRDLLIGLFLLSVAGFCFYQGRTALRNLKLPEWIRGN
jgi:hypothetical protein